MKTDLGLDLKKHLWYELRIKQELEDLGRRIQHAATVGRRIASRIPPGLVVWMEISRSLAKGTWSQKDRGAHGPP